VQASDELFRVGRHFLLELAARLYSFVDRDDVDSHRYEHRDDGPKSPVAMDAILWRLVFVQMFFVRMFVVMRHAINSSNA
jgi:hypothetical protein